MDMDSNLEFACRTCLSYTQQLQSVFDVHITGSEVYVTDFLRRLTSLKYAKGDELPRNICNICMEQIYQAFNFSQLCIATNNSLRSYLEKKLEIETTKQLVNTGDESDLDPQSTELKVNQLDLDSEQSKHNCEECPKEFGTRKSLNKHMRQHQVTEYPFKCPECSQGFYKQIQLDVHMRSHNNTEDKQFQCEHCDRKFTHLYLLKQHTYKHTKDKPFPCSKCDKGCLTAESLKRHMKVHEDTYKKKVHQCSVCKREFRYPSFLAEHMKNHTREKPFLCSICGKGFRQSGALDYHMRSHMGIKPFICNICHNSFMSRGVLRVHMRRHTNERPYSCELCGMAFKQSSDLKSHLRIHTGDKPALCSVCGKRMSTTGQLTVHLRSHTGEKPFSCTFCNKAFTTRAMLVKHERIHTGERPYVCNVCGKSFNQSSTLKTHTKRHGEQKDQLVDSNQEGFTNSNNTDYVLGSLEDSEQITTVSTTNEIVHVPHVVVLNETRFIS